MTQSSPKQVASATRKPRLRAYAAADREGVDRLYRQYFSEWSADGLWRRWRWQFDDNPFARERAARNLVLATDHEVVGYMGALPLPVRFRGQRHVALCGSGFVVDEPHRMQALSLIRALSAEPPFMGSSMSPAASALFRGLGGKMVPLSRERFTFRLRYDGAACVRVRQRLRRPLVKWVQPRMLAPVAARLMPDDAPPCQRLPPPPPRDNSIEPLTSFDRSYDALWAKASERTPSGIERSGEYMAWRYLACPDVVPLCFARRAGDGSLLGVAVGVRRAERDWTGGPAAVQGEITELILKRADDVATARHLLLTLMHTFDHWRVDSITATGLTHALAPVLTGLGFRREHSDDFAIGFTPPGAHAATHFCPEASDEWYVSGGDGETIFAVCV